MVFCMGFDSATKYKNNFILHKFATVTEKLSWNEHKSTNYY